MRKPLELAVKEYEGSERSFQEDLTNYLTNGYVYSGEDAFIMARPINLVHKHRWDDFNFKHKKPNCWFVFLAAGKRKLQRFQQLAPFKTTYVGWHRRSDNNIRTYRWNRFAKLAQENGIN
ncbi:hypothetical protein N8555_00835 [bacterium]|nr:hypothetical protein [bacterium]